MALAQFVSLSLFSYRKNEDTQSVIFREVKQITIRGPAEPHDVGSPAHISRGNPHRVSRKTMLFTSSADFYCHTFINGLKKSSCLSIPLVVQVGVSSYDFI